MNIDFISIINTCLIIVAAIFTYFRYFREGTHKQRIEFDIDYTDLGTRYNERIIEVGILAENKGNVEHRFKQISLNVRGIKNDQPLKEFERYKPRLKFPEDLHNIKIISEDVGYYFIRPKVKQRFPVVLKISSDISHLLLKADFYYKSGNFHTAERAFTIYS